MTKARTLADNFAADINGITAGTGITGGGTSGTVTVTNSMATAIDAKGDLVVGTGADTFSRLAVASTAGYLLSVDSAEATGLKWAAPAGGSFVGCSITKTAGQATTNGVFTAITWDSENFDTDGFHSTSTNTSRITIPSGQGGKYLFSYFVNDAASSYPAGALMQVALYKNGSSIAQTVTLFQGTVYFPQTATFLLEAVATDYFEIFVNRDYSSGTNIQAKGQFACQKIG
jgi:hypothetical protein